MPINKKQLAVFLLEQFDDMGLDKKLGDIGINDIFVLAKHLEEFIRKNAVVESNDEPPF